MKYIIGIAIIFSSFSAIAQGSNAGGGEREEQVLLDKRHNEPIKLADKKEKKRTSVKKKSKRIEKSK